MIDKRTTAYGRHPARGGGYRAKPDPVKPPSDRSPLVLEHLAAWRRITGTEKPRKPTGVGRIPVKKKQVATWKEPQIQEEIDKHG